MPGQATDGDQHGFLPTILAAVTRLTLRFPVVTLAVCLGLAGACVVYTQRDLQFKTSRGDLIDPKTDYHQRWLNYIKEFGDVTEDMVVVVEGKSPADIQQVLDDLGARVEKEPRLFKNVLYKVDLSHLRSKALQYSSPEQLQSILGQLDEFSPLLRRFQLLTLRGFFRELRHGLERMRGQPDEIVTRFAEPLLQQMGLLIASLDHFASRDRNYESPWHALAQGGGDTGDLETIFRDRYLLNEKGTMGFLKVQPTAHSSDFNGTSPAIARLRQLIDDATRRHPEVKFGLTGIPVLESDEMRDSQTAMFYASVISFVGVAILMFWGFQGFRYPLVGSAVLLVGMAWSFGFTTFAIGHLNILSVSFAAMLIGIGIDYSTVYLLRYLELRHEGLATAEALLKTATSAGAGIWTAAISSALAFFCAMLTDFAGVAELGVIAGGGILICTVAAFVVIPAILALVDRGHDRFHLPSPMESRGLRLLIARYPATLIVLCGGGIAWVSTYGLDMKYDYNLLHLQSKGLESVEVQSRIFEQSDSSLLFAVSLADSPRQVLELKRKFEALPTVHHVEELAAILPRYQSEETQLLVQGVHAELSQLPARPPVPHDIAPKQIGEELEAIEAALRESPSPSASSIRERIDHFLDRLDLMTDREQVQVLREYQGRLSADLLMRLRGLEAISGTDPVGPADLTPTLVSRFLSPNGKWLLQIYPASQIWDIEPLEKFIADVRSVDPEATGTPLQTYEASKAIKRSYETIGVYALIAVCVLLLIDFRNLTDCLMALLPPLAGAGLMFGLLALWHIDLNPANLIVLPLVIGLGVDGGVHVVHDYRLQRGPYAPSASVINAIIVNATTTMVGFGSMMIAAHRGLYSLGLVLTVGVGTCLVVAVVLVPAILTVVSRWRYAPSAAAPITDATAAATAGEPIVPAPDFGSIPEPETHAAFPSSPHFNRAETGSQFPWEAPPPDRLVSK
jgi:hopanoid biosynthesis associated RND transporter like protein HpnN